VAAASRAVRAPATLSAAAARRTGVRVAVTCRPACRVALRLTPARATRPVLATRSAAIGPGSATVVLRLRRGARLPRGGLAVRAAFARGATVVRRVAIR
jgi:hypothetical protein